MSPSVQARFVPLLFSRVMLLASVPSEMCEGKEERKDHQSKGSSDGEFVPAHATPMFSRKAGRKETLMRSLSLAVELPEELRNIQKHPRCASRPEAQGASNMVRSGHLTLQLFVYPSFCYPTTWIDGAAERSPKCARSTNGWGLRGEWPAVRWAQFYPWSSPR